MRVAVPQPPTLSPFDQSEIRYEPPRIHTYRITMMQETSRETVYFEYHWDEATSLWCAGSGRHFTVMLPKRITRRFVQRLLSVWSAGETPQRVRQVAAESGVFVDQFPVGIFDVMKKFLCEANLPSDLKEFLMNKANQGGLHIGIIGSGKSYPCKPFTKLFNLDEPEKPEA